ncbi:protein O-mannose kinase-like [Babylonia areolata]|uniref:protein O-mannose kinase-like n=1 Tax=Babylonia areolata TaxID=304850 RepID=UPI003FD10005
MATYSIVLPLSISVISILISIVWKLMDYEESVADDRMRCPSGHFILPGMAECHPYLNCGQISQQVVVKEMVGQGGVKLVRRGEWQNHNVAVNILANAKYREDFLHGLNMLQQLQANDISITQFVGECKHSDVFITQFYPLGSADRLEALLNMDHLHALNTLSVRFALCQDYVRILHSLHSGADGARVMCDSNDVNKTLSQFLLREDFSLVLNDVDALPLVDRSRGQLVKCGHRELLGEFVAPEQLWPYEDHDFVDSEMPGYDEKVDVWKVPDVCEAFLGRSMEGGAKLRLQLISVHLQCKSEDPSERPTALNLLEAYEKIHQKLFLS